MLLESNWTSQAGVKLFRSEPEDSCKALNFLEYQNMKLPSLFRVCLSAALLFLLHGGVAQEQLSVAYPTSRDAIEQALPSMEWRRVDTSHMDSLDGIIGIEIWSFSDGAPGKIKVHKRDLGSEEGSKSQISREIWLNFGTPVAERELFLYPGSAYEIEKGFRDGKLDSERSRSLDQEDGKIPDITTVSFEGSDPEFLADEEWTIQSFVDVKQRAKQLITASQAIGGMPGKGRSLMSRSHRIYLDNISPDGRYALAWEIEGNPSPDWARWEKESWDYLYSGGGSDPKLPISVISLQDGAVIGRLPHFNGEDGWADWARDGSFFVYSIETGHVGPIESSVYGVSPGGVSVVVPDLPGAVEGIALKELEAVNHPYSVRRTLMPQGPDDDSGVYIWIPSISEEGVIEVDTSFGRDYEGTLDQANLIVNVMIDPAAGGLRLVSSKIPEFAQIPMSWSEAENLLNTTAPTWITSPPVVDEYNQHSTAFDTGILALFNEFGKVLSPEVIEVVMKRSLYQSPSNYLDIYSPYEFSRYDPQAIGEINREVSRFLNPATVMATRALYEAKFRDIARDFNEALRYWDQNPSDLKHQEAVYLQHIKDETLPDGYYLLDGDLADQLMEKYSDDYEVQLRYLTGLRFWMRRSIDGSKGEFASILQKTIQAFDSDYFSRSGLPNLIVNRP